MLSEEDKKIDFYIRKALCIAGASIEDAIGFREDAFNDKLKALKDHIHELVKELDNKQ